MRTPPTNWTTLMAQPHETETRLDIAGVSYYGYDGNSGIWSCETRPMLFDKLSVGNCCSATINLVLVNPQTIPTMAKMELYVRLVGKEVDETIVIPRGRMRGDINGNGTIENDGIDWRDGGRSDVAYINGYLANLGVDLDEIQYWCADTGGDGVVLSDDAIRLIRRIAWGDIDYYPNVDYYGNWTFQSDVEKWKCFIQTNIPSGIQIDVPSGYSYEYTNGGINVYAENPPITEFSIRVQGRVQTDWVRKGIYYIDTREWDARHEFLTITGYDAMLKTEQDFVSEEIVGQQYTIHTVDFAIGNLIAIEESFIADITSVYWTNRDGATEIEVGDYLLFSDWKMKKVASKFNGFILFENTARYSFPDLPNNYPMPDVMAVCAVASRIGVALDERNSIDKAYEIQMPAVSSDGKDSDTLREVLGWIGGMYGGNWCITDEGKLRLVPLVPTQTVAVGTDALDLSTTPAYDALGIVHLVVSEDAEYVAGTSGRSIEISCPWGTQDMADNILAAIGGYVYQPLTVTTATEANPLWELGDGVTVNGYTSVIASMPTAFGLKYTADIEAPESEEINHEYPYQDKGTRDIERKIAKTSASFEIVNNKISAIVQNVGSEGTVTAASIIAAINDDTSEVKISADKIGITGFVTFSDLSTSGKTTINGENITTGTIAAERLDLSGTLRVGSNISSLTNNVGYQTTNGVTTIIGNTVNTGYINALNITARNIKGNSIAVYGSNGATSYGTIYAGTNTEGTTALELNGSYGLRLIASGNSHNVYLAGTNGGSVLIGADSSGSGTARLGGVHVNGLFCGSWLCMGSGYYGTGNPSTAVSTPYEGMLYFKIT